jgi:hypothetical protein
MERSAHPRCGMDRRRSLAGMLWAGATGWLPLHPGWAEAAPAPLPTD